VVAAWLGYDFMANNFIEEHGLQFGALDGFSKRDCIMLNVAWTSTLWTIWKERDGHIFK
jgi:hypothetical protein